MKYFINIFYFMVNLSSISKRVLGLIKDDLDFTNKMQNDIMPFCTHIIHKWIVGYLNWTLCQKNSL